MESVPDRPVLAVYEDLAQRVNHTLVHPALTDKEVRDGCLLAADLGLQAVTVRPSDIDEAIRALRGSTVAVGTVIGFPHGSTTTPVKQYEIRDAIRRGAKEVDVVPNLGKLRSRQFQYLESELGQMAEACQEHGATLKVTLENPLLTDELKIVVCRILSRVGAQVAKTATGFGPGGCTEEDLLLMRGECGSRIEIEAAAGIRTLEAALRAYLLGADRIGTTHSAEILTAWKAKLAEPSLAGA